MEKLEKLNKINKRLDEMQPSSFTRGLKEQIQKKIDVIEGNKTVTK